MQQKESVKNAFTDLGIVTIYNSHQLNRPTNQVDRHRLELIQKKYICGNKI